MRLASNERQAQEAEAAHAREVALMASSLHRLGGAPKNSGHGLLAFGVGKACTEAL